MSQALAPVRPARWREALASRLFLAFAPRLSDKPRPRPPRNYRPFEELHVPRRDGHGTLTASWFPAREEKAGPVRGAILFLHPWLVWGRAYFHRRRRIESVRRAGYHALTLDFSGFGGSGPLAGFPDRDIQDALALLRRKAPDLPHHIWGVSAGGYWAHLVLSRQRPVASAVFEDVSSHLLEWSNRMEPWGRPFYGVFRRLFADWHRFLDLRAHARLLGIPTVYISGALDPGVFSEETRELATLAGGECLIVPDADHLESIKRQQDEVIALAIRTFAQAEEQAGVAAQAGVAYGTSADQAEAAPLSKPSEKISVEAMSRKTALTAPQLPSVS